jgi:hypothetical protein
MREDTGSSRIHGGGAVGAGEYPLRTPGTSRMSYDEDIRLAPYHYQETSLGREGSDGSVHMYSDPYVPNGHPHPGDGDGRIR